MTTYERWKYCGRRLKHTNQHGTRKRYCHNTADEECTCGETHWDEDRHSMAGVLSGTAKPDFDPKNKVDHPRFTCDPHLPQYE